MPLEWKQSLETGIREIDDQHKELFNRVNQLFEACYQGKGKEEVAKIIDFLGDYVITHFKSEENIQQKHNYPDYKNHKLQHEAFIQDFIKLKSQLDNYGASSFFVLEVNKRIIDWLVQHIGKTDMVLGDFLKAKV